MLLQLAAQSVLRRPRAWLVALLASGAAALLMVALAFVGGVYDGTRRSIIESGAGTFQLYNPASPDAPMLMGGPGGAAELKPLDAFADVAEVVRGVPAVKDVLPMEVGAGEHFRGNYLDERLKVLRKVLRQPESQGRAARLERMYAELRQTLAGIAQDERRREEVFVSGPTALEDARALRTVTSDAFWEQLRERPSESLEYIENTISKQLGEGESMVLEFVAADLSRFQQAFPRVELLSGAMPPKLTRGLVVGTAFYEQNFKLPVAYRLDVVARERAQGRRLADDEELRALLERNLAELPDVIDGLDVERAAALHGELEALLGRDGALGELLGAFLTLDDGSFDERYRLFYERLAPQLVLYRAVPGDLLVIRHPEENVALKVRLFGTFRFKGLGPDQGRINALSLLDPVSAHYLSKHLTHAQMQESRELIEAFDMAGEIPTHVYDGISPPAVIETLAAPRTVAPGEHDEFSFRSASGPPETYAPEDVDARDVRQAAVVLDPSADEGAVEEAIRAALAARKLEADLADWTSVGGLVSQVVVLSRVLLLVFGLVIALVVMLVALSVLLIMGRERVGEVGTARAVGMQRWQVFGQLLLEGLTLGIVGSGVGVALSALLLASRGGRGFPVSSDTLQVFLGGPALFPRVETWHAVTVMALVVLQVVIASVASAWRGSKVSPIVAMSRGDA